MSTKYWHITGHVTNTKPDINAQVSWSEEEHENYEQACERAHKEKENVQKLVLELHPSAPVRTHYNPTICVIRLQAWVR